MLKEDSHAHRDQKLCSSGPVTGKQDTATAANAALGPALILKELREGFALPSSAGFL